MPEYKVAWRLDEITASTPVEAAAAALDTIRADNAAAILYVKDAAGDVFQVDLTACAFTVDADAGQPDAATPLGPNEPTVAAAFDQLWQAIIRAVATPLADLAAYAARTAAALGNSAWR